MTNPIVIKFIGENIRPDSERIRSAYARGVDLATRMSSTIAPILAAEGLIVADPQTGAIAPAAGQEGTVLDDGRAGEGVSQLTVAEFCKLVNTFGGLTQTLAADPVFLAAISKACVRSIEVSH